MQMAELSYDIHTAFGLVFIFLKKTDIYTLQICMITVNRYRSNPAKGVKISRKFSFSYFFGEPQKGFMKAVKALS